MQDSPAYRLNHEEVQKALEEGIDFVECMNPAEAVPDEYNAVKALIFERLEYVAETGKFENNGRDARVSGPHGLRRGRHIAERNLRKGKAGHFQDGRMAAVFPAVQGRAKRRRQASCRRGRKGRDRIFHVVRIGRQIYQLLRRQSSEIRRQCRQGDGVGKDGYEKVVELFADELATRGTLPQAERDAIFDKLEATLDEQLRAYVVKVDRLTPTIVDVIVKAPLQARKFEPGQFYRLQNFETSAPVVDGTRLMMEGLALTGAWVDEEKGLLSMIVLEMGTSSRLCSLLKEGEEVLVMGPTGSPTEIPENETVLLAGGGLGNAVLFSIAEGVAGKQQ